MLKAQHKKSLTKRVRFIAGQLDAILKMIDNDEDSEKILQQLRSVESALQSSVLETFESAHRLQLAEQIVQELEDCPGSCQYCQLVETLKRDFPKLTITQVFDGLHQLHQGKK